jgi:hypothetical protein
MHQAERFVPFMERLTPAQKRKFRAGMKRLRRQFEKQPRDARKGKLGRGEWRMTRQKKG